MRQVRIADFLGLPQALISEVEAGESNLTVDQLERVANLCGYSLAAFDGGELGVRPTRLASCARKFSRDDLCVIADIQKIAINGRFMAQLPEEPQAG